MVQHLSLVLQCTAINTLPAHILPVYIRARELGVDLETTREEGGYLPGNLLALVRKKVGGLGADGLRETKEDGTLGLQVFYRD
ncbi:hypothetical protein EON64_07415 [archaeon]|nr:MAG: hypothetical protein EON64_07415 [archaeon]